MYGRRLDVQLTKRFVAYCHDEQHAHLCQCSGSGADADKAPDVFAENGPASTMRWLRLYVHADGHQSSPFVVVQQ